MKKKKTFGALILVLKKYMYKKYILIMQYVQIHVLCFCFFQDFKAHDSSYKIPKKTNSSNVGAKRGDEWFESSFEVKLPPPGRSKYRQASSISGKKRYDADRITQRNEIGYRALRQGVLTSPSRRWKHADAPGWRHSEVSRSQQENILSCQGVIFVKK